MNCNGTTLKEHLRLKDTLVIRTNSCFIFLSLELRTPQVISFGVKNVLIREVPLYGNLKHSLSAYSSDHFLMQCFLHWMTSVLPKGVGTAVTFATTAFSL